MRSLILAACAALLALAASPVHASFTPDDRYFDSRAPAAQSKVKVRHAAHRKPVRRAAPSKRWRGPIPVPRSRPGTVRNHMPEEGVSRRTILPHDRITLTTADEQPKRRRETGHYAPQEGPAPVTFSGPRPSAWCGWFLGKLLGLHDRKLWLARNWAHVGAPAVKQPGVIVVWRHHVGKITAVRADGAIKVLSGNDGRAVRDRWRSAKGVIAYRML